MDNLQRPEYLVRMEDDLMYYVSSLRADPAKKEMRELGEFYAKVLQNREQMEMEFLEKQRRREMEEKRNDAAAKAENKKLHMSWERFLLETLGIFAPLVFSAALIPYMAKWEETNRCCSSIAREVWHLPKMFIKRYK